MNSFATNQLKAETFFSSDLLLDKSFMLLPYTCPVTETLLNELKEWDFTAVITEGTVTTSASVASDTPEIETNTFTSKASSSEEKTILQSCTEEAKSSFEAAKNLIHANDSEDATLEIVNNVLDSFSEFVNAVYTRYATHTEIDYESLSVIVKDLCVFVKDNRRFVLRSLDQKGTKGRNFLVSHAVRSTIYAISIGMQLRRPLSELIELGVACILHEIGMIKLPAQLYISNRRLNPNERRLLFAHPIQSYNILKGFDFPLTICRGVLEHHERENGTGYPRKLTSQDISPFAKIISVACSFEAITAPRMHKEAQTSYDAMVEMLRNDNKAYDATTIKALLSCLSLFPLGSFVFLSNGKVAQVVDINPANSKNPIVELVLEKDKEGKPVLLQTDNTTIAIRRALSKQESEDIRKMIEQRQGKA